MKDDGVTVVFLFRGHAYIFEEAEKCCCRGCEFSSTLNNGDVSMCHAFNDSTPCGSFGPTLIGERAYYKLTRIL